MTHARHHSHELNSQSLQSLSENLHEALRVSICQTQISQALFSFLDSIASWRKYKRWLCWQDQISVALFFFINSYNMSLEIWKCWPVPHDAVIFIKGTEEKKVYRRVAKIVAMVRVLFSVTVMEQTVRSRWGRKLFHCNCCEKKNLCVFQLRCCFRPKEGLELLWCCH